MPLWLRLLPKYIISQIQLRINQLAEVLRLIISGAMNCAPTLKRETLKPIRRGAIHRLRSRPHFVTVFAKYCLRQRFLDQLAGVDGGALGATVVEVRQVEMIETEQMQDRRVDVVDVIGFVDCLEA